MRGKVKITETADLEARITPAYAGKRHQLEYYRLKPEDHPRLCGEKLTRSTLNSQNWGSPPPMRGKVRVGEAYSRAYRITPAYAGKSCGYDRRACCVWDHPRLCGEKRKFFRKMLIITGSPPPMRGKVRRCRFSSMPDRITPAYAGKS